MVYNSFHISSFRPVHTYPDIFWIRNFFFPDSASIYTYQVYPAYESASFWIHSPERKFLNTLWIQNRVDAKPRKCTVNIQDGAFRNVRDLKHQDGRGGRRLTGSEKSHFDSSAHANRLHHPVLPSSSTWSEEFWRRAQNVSKFWLFLSWNVTVGSKYLM